MTNSETIRDREPRRKALLPFGVFMIFYLGLSIWSGDFYRVSMPVAFLIASATAMFLDRKLSLTKKVDLYARGMGDSNIMIMCLIFTLAGAFAATAKGMGAVDSAVVIARCLVPENLLLLGMFLVSCFISLAVGTSCGTIAAIAPIAVELVSPAENSPALMLGAVIGGAMFGDNMSMISDTTIAATRTQNVAMREKFITNFKIVLPAAIAAVVIYLVAGHGNVGIFQTETVHFEDFFKVTPYLMILIFALCGMNVMALLFFGTVLAAIIGILTHSFDFWGALDLCGEGTLSMSETLIVAILSGGLLGMIRHNGGIDYILNKINRGVSSQKGCEFGVFLLVAIVNLFTANNTVAIVIAGPIARELSQKFNCEARRIASILDTASCAVQGLIPYGAQLLIAIGIAQTMKVPMSSLELVSKLHYPQLVGVALLVSIFARRRK